MLGQLTESTDRWWIDLDHQQRTDPEAAVRTPVNEVARDYVFNYPMVTVFPNDAENFHVEVAFYNGELRPQDNFSTEEEESEGSDGGESSARRSPRLTRK